MSRKAATNSPMNVLTIKTETTAHTAYQVVVGATPPLFTPKHPSRPLGMDCAATRLRQNQTLLAGPVDYAQSKTICLAGNFTQQMDLVVPYKQRIRKARQLMFRLQSQPITRVLCLYDFATKQLSHRPVWTSTRCSELTMRTACCATPNQSTPITPNYFT